MSAREGEPSPISDLLNQVLRGLGAPAASTLTRVFGAWEEIVGEAVAAHAQPLRIEGGRLVVGVDDPTWATELRYRASELVKRLAEALRSDEITHLDVVLRTGE